MLQNIQYIQFIPHILSMNSIKMYTQNNDTIAICYSINVIHNMLNSIAHRTLYWAFKNSLANLLQKLAKNFKKA